MISILESNQIWTELHKTSHEISIIIQNNRPERISFKFGDDENWDDGRERRHLTWPQFKWCSNVGTELWDYYCRVWGEGSVITDSFLDLLLARLTLFILGKKIFCSESERNCWNKTKRDKTLYQSEGSGDIQSVTDCDGVACLARPHTFTVLISKHEQHQPIFSTASIWGEGEYHKT